MTSDSLPRFRWIGTGAGKNSSMWVVDRENCAALQGLGWQLVDDSSRADILISFHHQDHPDVAPDRSGRVRVFYLCTGGHNGLVADRVERYLSIAETPRNHIFVLNRASQASFAAAGIVTHVWNHGYDPLQFRPGPRTGGRVLTFGYVGQGEPFKRHEFLTECFVAAFTDSDVPVHLQLMTGWGHVPGFPVLPDRVSIVPLREHEQMAGFYRGLDCLVNYSYAEGYNLPPLEALACGTPCLVTDMPEMREPPFDQLCRHVPARPIVDTSRFLDTPFAPRDPARYFSPPWIHEIQRDDGIRALREFAKSPDPHRQTPLPQEHTWTGRIRNQLFPVIATDLGLDDD